MEKQYFDEDYLDSLQHLLTLAAFDCSVHGDRVQREAAL